MHDKAPLIIGRCIELTSMTFESAAIVWIDLIYTLNVMNILSRIKRILIYIKTNSLSKNILYYRYKSCSNDRNLLLDSHYRWCLNYSIADQAIHQNRSVGLAKPCLRFRVLREIGVRLYFQVLRLIGVELEYIRLR